MKAICMFIVVFVACDTREPERPVEHQPPKIQKLTGKELSIGLVAPDTVAWSKRERFKLRCVVRNRSNGIVDLMDAKGELAVNGRAITSDPYIFVLTGGHMMSILFEPIELRPGQMETMPIELGGFEFDKLGTYHFVLRLDGIAESTVDVEVVP